MEYSDLDALLKDVLPETYHLSAPRGLARYVVWMEVGSHSDFGDDRRGLTVLMANVYVYVQDEKDALLGEVLEALDRACVAYSDPIPDFDDETLTINWIVEVEIA